MDKDTLKDVLIHLKTGKYSKREILDALAWGEKNTDIFYPYVKMYRPDYYNGDPQNPVMSCSLVLDLKLNEP